MIWSKPWTPIENDISIGLFRTEKKTPGPLVQTWDIETGQKVADLKPGIGQVRAIKFGDTADTLTMAVGYEDEGLTGSAVTGYFRQMGAGGLQLWKWDVKNNRGAATTLGVSGWSLVFSFDVAFSDDGKTLLACGGGSKIAAAFSFDVDKILADAQGLVFATEKRFPSKAAEG